MSEIEHWSIELLSKSLANSRAHGSSLNGALTMREKAAPAAITRTIRYFSHWRKRHAPLAKAD